MSKPQKPERFVLMLRDEDHGDPDASPAANRLKRALKILLRSFGLRCTRAELFEVPPVGALRDAVGRGADLRLDEPPGADRVRCRE